MGEFGAVSVISGNIIGRTQTLTLYVESAYKVRQLHRRLLLRGNQSCNQIVLKGVRMNQLLMATHAALQEYNTEAAFSASVLLSFLAVLTLFVKEALEQQASQETRK